MLLKRTRWDILNIYKNLQLKRSIMKVAEQKIYEVIENYIRK